MTFKKIKTKHLLSVAVIGIIAVFFVFTFSSCQKNTDCTGVVTVTDTVGNPLSGAAVTLYFANPPAGKTSTTTTQNTDGSGKTTFVFKLQAIYDIDVNYSGKLNKQVGMIKLEPGQTVNKAVIWK